MKALLRLFVPALFLCAASASAQDDRLIVEATVSASTETAYDVAWHPDGDLLAVTGGASVTVYDTDLQPVTEPLPATGVNLVWSPDGDQLATVDGFRARSIRLWDWDADTRTVEESSPVAIDSDQYAVTWSPDGEALVTLDDDRGIKNDVTLWDVDSGSLIWSVTLPYAPALRVLDWSGEKLRGAGKDADGVLLIFEIDPADGTAVELQALDPDVSLFAFSPDDALLATITEAGDLTISEADTGESLLILDSLETPVSIAFAPDGARLAVLGYERQMQIWDVSGLSS